MVFSVELNLENFVTYLEVLVNSSKDQDFEIVGLVKLGVGFIIDKDTSEFTKVNIDLIRKT